MMRRWGVLGVVVFVGVLVLAAMWAHRRDALSGQWWQQVRQYLSLTTLLQWAQRVHSVPHLQEAAQALQRQDWVKAEKALRRALQVDPSNTEAWVLLVQVLRQQGRTNDAIALAMQIPDRKARVNALLVLADMFYLQGDYKRAEPLYRQVLRLDPDNAVALNNYGYMLAQLGMRLDEAERMVRKALQQQPNEPAFLDSLGWVYYQKGDYRRALVYLRRAVQGRPNDAEVRYHLGMTYWQLGDLARARRELERALQLDPTYRPAREALDALERHEKEQEMRGETVRT